MPQKVNPEIIKYYQARIQQLDQRIASLWNIMKLQADTHREQLKMAMTPQYRAVLEAHYRKLESDTKTEMRRLGSIMSETKRKVESWMQR